jgi:hypothetical protein
MKTGHSAVVNKNKDFCIGGNIAGANANCFFGGVIDDIRIYNRALNAGEVVALYYGYEHNNVKDLRVFITNHPNPRPGFNEHLYVVYQNIGTNVMNGYVELNYDSNYTFIQSTPTQDSIGPNYLGWNVYNLAPGAQGFFDVETNLPATVALGTQLESTAMINPFIGDTTDFDNFDTLRQTVVGGYDPNYLEVIPEGDIAPSFVAAQNYLYYIIHFQNTGTADAINVRTENQIDTNLFVSSLEVIAASHPYTFSLSNANLLKFNFNNIHLPDSGTNMSASNGFIIYRIKPKNNLVIGNEIKNTASIFFDFNPAVITNTTTTKVGIATSFNSVNNNALNKLIIHPNPVYGDQAFVSFNSQINGEGYLRLYDLFGKLILTKKVKINKDTNNIEFSSHSIQKGVYLLNLTFGDKSLKSILIKQ